MLPNVLVANFYKKTIWGLLFILAGMFSLLNTSTLGEIAFIAFLFYPVIEVLGMGVIVKSLWALRKEDNRLFDVAFAIKLRETEPNAPFAFDETDVRVGNKILDEWEILSQPLRDIGLQLYFLAFTTWHTSMALICMLTSQFCILYFSGYHITAYIFAAIVVATLFLISSMKANFISTGPRAVVKQEFDRKS